MEQNKKVVSDGNNVLHHHRLARRLVKKLIMLIKQSEFDSLIPDSETWLKIHHATIASSIRATATIHEGEQTWLMLRINP